MLTEFLSSVCHMAQHIQTKLTNIYMIIIPNVEHTTNNQMFPS